MIIRQAQPADAPAIATIREVTIRTIVAPMNLYSPEEIDSWAANFPAARVAAFIEEGNYLVAEDGGRILGFGRLHLGSPGLAVIRGVFVDAGFVGRGIGGQIVKRLLAIGQSLAATRFDLVSTLNARSFYERLGFCCLERVEHTTSNGAVIPGYHMRFEVQTP
jgi:N-acetylglutamate synthase-like GNAT family acetyltransferase